MESSHYLAGGVVVTTKNTVLLVRDSSGWTLPRGSTEAGESFAETSKREAVEETGYDIAVKDVAFIAEFTTEKYGQFLQVYYAGELVTDAQMFTPDENEIFEVKFVPINELRSYLKARPQVIPLEKWLEERLQKYYFFDLDREGFEI